MLLTAQVTKWGSLSESWRDSGIILLISFCSDLLYSKMQTATFPAEIDCLTVSISMGSSIPFQHGLTDSNRQAIIRYRS